MFFPGERFGAYLARVRRVTRVLLQVIGQMLLPCECFVTELASVRRFACVYSVSK